MKLSLHGNSGKYAEVDADDYDMLSQYKWYLSKDGYAARRSTGGTTYMHRLVMDTPKDMQTDHINRDRLDNRKANLRICTNAENQKNRKTRRGTVHKIRVNGYEYWTGVIKVDLKRYQTTTCPTREMAEGALKQLIIDKEL